MTKVLVVEDNEQNMYLLKIVLEGNGYEMSAAGDGLEALEIARKDKPDIIISDILMPVMDGFALCRQWKKDEQLKQIPFIFYTATYTDAKDEEFALSLGAERFVRKPTAPDKFIAILKEIIQNQELGKLKATEQPAAEEKVFFKEYNQALVRKLEKKMLELEQANKSLSALFRTSTSFSSFKQFEDLIGDIFHEFLPLMNCIYGQYFEFDKNQKEFHLLMAAGHTQQEVVKLKKELSFKLGEERGLVGLVGQTQKPLVINDTLKDPRWIPTEKKTLSVMFMPITYEGQIEGVLSFLSAKKDNFNEKISQGIITLANNLAIVVEKTRLFERIKQSEQSLRESEKFLNSVIENIPNMVFVKDARELCFVRINKAGEELLGLSRTEMLGKSDRYFFPPDEAEHFIKKDKETLKTHEIVEIPEEIILSKNKGKRILHTKKITIRGETGEPKYLLGISEDITERMQRIEALRESTERFTQAFEFAPNGITLVRLDGKYIQANQSFCNTIGYSEQELLEKTFQEITFADDLESDLDYVRQLLAGEITTYQMEKRYIHKRGHLVWALLRVSLVHDRDGKPQYFLSQMQDITEHKRAEQLLNALNQAAQVMQSAFTPQAIFDAVSAELNKYFITCMLFTLNEKQDQLMTKYLGFDSAGIKRIEELAEIKSQDFSFPVDQVNVYHQVINKRETIFLEDAENVMKQLFPRMFKKLPRDVTAKMFTSDSIITPLIVGNNLIGVFSLHSSSFLKEDVPIVTAFGNQLAAAWNKAELTAKLQQTLNGIIQTIAMTVEIRDPYTAGHQERVSELAAAIAREMHLPENQIEGVRIAGAIHDIGKISVPAELLSKPGLLSEIEFNLIKTHSQSGFGLISNIDFPWPLAQTILQHHEKLDGSGYPQGLKGNQIITEARVVTVADVVEAMSSHRPYRAALGIDKAMQEIKEKKGTWYDPAAVDACVKVFEKGFKFD